MKRIITALCLLGALVVFNSCQKEYSYEGGINTGGGGSGGGSGNTGDGTSRGTLGGSPNACSNTSVFGSYAQATRLTDSNYILVEVTIDTIGSYTIGTDTLNGIYFLQSGTFTTTGVQLVKIKGWGTPLNPATFTHTVKYKSSRCSFDVTTSAVVVAPVGDYFPTTTGSNWTYIDDDPTATLSDTSRNTSIGSMATFGGKSYSIFEGLDDSNLKDSSYFRKGSGLYYEYGDLDALGFTDSPVFGEVIMLKDNVAQGNSWESSAFTTSVGGIPGSLKAVSTLLEKNVTKQIGSKSYSNVMVVKTSYQIKISIAPFTELNTREAWYAKGIGFIRISATVPGVGSAGINVQRYEIK